MTSTIQENGRRPLLFRQMEDDLNFSGKWKMTSALFFNEDNIISICNELDLNLIFNEDGLNFQLNERRSQLQPGTTRAELGTAQPQLVTFV